MNELPENVWPELGNVQDVILPELLISPDAYNMILSLVPSLVLTEELKRVATNVELVDWYNVWLFNVAISASNPVISVSIVAISVSIIATAATVAAISVTPNKVDKTPNVIEASLPAGPWGPWSPLSPLLPWLPWFPWIPWIPWIPWFPLHCQTV